MSTFSTKSELLKAVLTATFCHLCGGKKCWQFSHWICWWQYPCVPKFAEFVLVIGVQRFKAWHMLEYSEYFRIDSLKHASVSLITSFVPSSCDLMRFATFMNRSSEEISEEIPICALLRIFAYFCGKFAYFLRQNCWHFCWNQSSFGSSWAHFLRKI